MLHRFSYLKLYENIYYETEIKLTESGFVGI